MSLGAIAKNRVRYGQWNIDPSGGPPNEGAVFRVTKGLLSTQKPPPGREFVSGKPLRSGSGFRKNAVRRVQFFDSANVERLELWPHCSE